ncbi:MAG: flagellin [Candidatus Sulfotelmatobacter sp.]
MPLGILNNIPSLQAENELDLTASALNNTLEQLASGSRINSGADDPAGLSIANGLEANISALTQSVSNANDGVGQLQLADGALAQVTNLLNTAVTLATESATGTVSNGQRTAIQAQYASILAEINQIGTATTYNGQSVFQSGTSTNVNQAASVNSGTNAPVTLNTALTVGDTTAITAGGITFTFTAANQTATAPNPNQVGSSLTTTAAGAAALTSGTVTITAGGKSQTFTGGAGGITTVATLETAINAATDLTGVQATQNAAGNIEIVDPNNNGDLTVTTTGALAAGAATILGSFSNPVVAVTNPNEDVGSVTGYTATSILTPSVAVDITVGGKTGIYTLGAASAGHNEISQLITAINTGADGSGSVTVTGNQTGAYAFLNSAGALEIVDPGNNNDLSVTGALAAAGAGNLGVFTPAPEVVAPTVQTLVNAINSSADTAGAQAAVVGGQLQITDPLNRADLQVVTDDTVLGAPVSGAPTNFLNTTTTAAATVNTNELIGNKGSSGVPITADTALTTGAVDQFTAGGKTFTFTATGAAGGETVGDLIAAINTPYNSTTSTGDAAGLHAYIGTVSGTGTATQLIITDPNDNNDVAVGSGNTETALGTYTNPNTSGSTTTNIFLSDSTAIGSAQIAVTIGGLATAAITNGSGAAAVDLATTDLSTQTDAQTALTLINSAITNIASVRGTLGASVNRLTAASNVINSQVQNLTSAENTITAADIPSVVANLTKYSILEQTGISALAQANQQQQLVLKLLQ